MRNVMYRGIALCAVGFALGLASPASALTTDQVVNDTQPFVEWALGFKLDSASIQSIREGVATDMRSDPAGAQATVKDMNTVMAWVHSHSDAEVAMLRSLIEPQLIAAWQGDTSASGATGRTLIAAWEKHHRIIAKGTPPLRESVAKSYIAMFEFLCKQTGRQVPAAVANHAQFKQHIASLYAAASPADQMKFNGVQTLWLSLQSVWSGLSPAQQAAMRQQWRNPSHTSFVSVPQPAPPPSSGFTGQTWTVQRWSEHNFVESESESMMSSWSNPFG